MSYYEQEPGYQQGYTQQPSYGQQPGYSQQYQGQQEYQQGVPMQQQHQASVGEGIDTGSYQGVSWTIKHRKTNSIVTVNLPNPGEMVKSRTGAMVHMSAFVRMEGNVNFSMKKLFTGGQIMEVTYAGPGNVTLAPMLMGDIATIQVNTPPPQKGHAHKHDVWTGWNVAKHCYLACSAGVDKDTHSQGFKNSLFSGDGVWVYRMMGQGVAWITSYGALEAIQLAPGEEHIVDHGYLVAWNAQYTMERAGRSTTTMMNTGEGMVARFVGPGTVYIHTRNLVELAMWVREQSAGS